MGDDIHGLKNSIDALNHSVNSLMKLFKEASEELKTEKNDPEIVDKKINPVLEKIAALEEQNEKIARGIVAVADMLKEQKNQYRPPMQVKPSQQPLIKPGLPTMNLQPQAPRQMGPPRQFQVPAVKPWPRSNPEKKEEKKGFLDMFKK